MQVPLQITARGISLSEAAGTDIHVKAANLATYYDLIMRGIGVFIMLTSALLVGFAVLFSGTSAFAGEPSALVEQGQQLFFKQGCYGCHTVGKAGTPIGPGLSQVGAQYSLSYLTEWLHDPSSQKRTAHMPKIELAEDEIRALAAYLASLK